MKSGNSSHSPNRPAGSALARRSRMVRRVSGPVMLVLASLLAACSPLAPKYQRPALDLPASMAPASANSVSSNGTATGPASSKTASTPLQTWWQLLQDPVLDGLLAEAQANNQDLVLAAARIVEARANVDVTESNHYPTLDGNLGASRSRSSTTTGKLPAGSNAYGKDVQFGVTAAYEVDFWGKHNQADAAARARLLAQESNRALVHSSLMADIAQRYCALRSYDAQLALARSLLKTRQQNLHLQQKRFAGGVVGEIEFNAAKVELASSEASVSGLQQLVASTETALALLAGRSPQAIANPVIARGAPIEELYQHLATPALLSPDFSLNLLQRRPDIVSAEQNLIAANADIADARSRYFPSIKLTANLGRDARSLSELFNPASIIWNIGSSLTQPLLRGGAIDAVVAGSEARKNQATAQYVQSVQSAFRDVRDALNNLDANAQVQSATADKLASQQDSRRLAQLRFDKGYSSAVDLLNAERDVLQVQSSLIDSERTHLQAMVALYKAVGAGWDGK